MSIVCDASVEVQDRDPRKMLEALFVQLGKPEHAGHAFAMTSEAIDDIGLFAEDGKLRLEKLPRPDYEHRVYRDTRSGNYLVVRPDATGRYGEEKHCERLR